MPAPWLMATPFRHRCDSLRFTSKIKIFLLVVFLAAACCMLHLTALRARSTSFSGAQGKMGVADSGPTHSLRSRTAPPAYPQGNRKGKAIILTYSEGRASVRGHSSFR
eukprot:scaffold106_cov380-Prasinococcus_capsulatus_cf.AAC.28